MTWPGEANRENPNAQKALDEWYREIRVRQGPSFEEYDLLWKAMLDKVKEIDKASKADRTNRGSSREPGMISMGSKAIDTLFTIWQSDGRSKLHHIQARFRLGDLNKELDKRVIQVTVDVYWSDNDRFNQERLDRLKKEPDKILIVNHQFYAIGSGGNGGFGGRLIKFQRLTGRVYDGEKTHGPTETTTDLWYSGVIPPAWRDRLPDNAVFLDNFNGPTVMY